MSTIKVETTLKVRAVGSTDGPEFKIHRNFYRASEERAKKYREEENARREEKGAGLLLKERYVPVLCSRARTINTFQGQWALYGNKHQKKVLATALEILQLVEDYVEAHCEARCVTLTKDYVFTVPVSEISKRSGKGGKEVDAYLILLSVLGLIERLPHDLDRGEAYIGNLGIRAQYYRLPGINSSRVCDRWSTWCRSGGAISHLNRRYLEEIFGASVVAEVYHTPEATGDSSLRESFRKRKSAPDYWANNNTDTNFFVAYRHARLEIKRAISEIRSKVSRIELDQYTNTRYVYALPCKDRRVRVNLPGGRYLWLSNDDLLNVAKMASLWKKFHTYDRSVFLKVCHRENWSCLDHEADIARIWNNTVAWFPALFWDENGERRQFGSFIPEPEDAAAYPCYYAHNRKTVREDVEVRLYQAQKKAARLAEARYEFARGSFLTYMKYIPDSIEKTALLVKGMSIYAKIASESPGDYVRLVAEFNSAGREAFPGRWIEIPDVSGYDPDKRVRGKRRRRRICRSVI